MQAPLTEGWRTGLQRLRRVHEAAPVTDGRLAAVRAALRQPDIRRIELGYGMSVTGSTMGSRDQLGRLTRFLEQTGARPA